MQFVDHTDARWLIVNKQIEVYWNSTNVVTWHLAHGIYNGCCNNSQLSIFMTPRKHCHFLIC